VLVTNFIEKPVKYRISLDDVESGLPIALNGMYQFIGGDSTNPDIISQHPDYIAAVSKDVVKNYRNLIKSTFKRLVACGNTIDSCVKDGTLFNDCIALLRESSDIVIDGGDIDEETNTSDALKGGFLEFQVHERLNGEAVSIFVGFHKKCTHFITSFSNGTIFKMRFFNKMRDGEFIYPDILSALHPQILFPFATVITDPAKSIHERIGGIRAVFKAIQKANIPQLEDLVVPEECDEDDDDEDGPYESDFIDDEDFEPDSGEDDESDSEYSDSTHYDEEEEIHEEVGSESAGGADDEEDEEDEDEEDEEEEEDGVDENENDQVPKKLFWSCADFDAQIVPRFESVGNIEYDTMILEFFEDAEIVYRYDQM